MNRGEVTNSMAPGTDVVGDAVGVDSSCWFVAIVNNNTEKRSAEKLAKMGITTYLPTQTVMRVWKNGRKAKVDRVVLPSLVFVHCTEQDRREIVKLPFVNRFMVDRAASTVGSNAVKPIARIPDNEISRLKFMLGQSDIPVAVVSRSYRRGDKVRVIRGSLAGLEGVVADLASSKSELAVELGMLGCAILSIETINVEPA